MAVRFRPPQPYGIIPYRPAKKIVKEVVTQTETVATGMDAVIAAMTTITELVGSVFDVMTGNPLLTVFLAAGLLTVGISIFTQLKSATRG